jgi:phosphatidylglycerophosphate synthase
VVTLAGPITASLALLPAYYGSQRGAAGVLVVSGAFDVLDGAVARLSKGVSAFGGYLDSIADRYSDFCILFAIIVFIERHWHEPHRLIYLVLWGLVVVGTTTTAYARARAETAIPSCKVGFMERPERTVTVILGLACANVHISLWILAPMTNLIAVQRILYTRLQMQRRAPRGRFWIWTHARITSPHFVLCAVFIVALIFGHLLLSRP